MAHIDSQRSKTIVVVVALLSLLTIVLIGGTWLYSNSTAAPDSQLPPIENSVLEPTSVNHPTATLLITPVVNQVDTLQLSLLSESKVQLMGLTIELVLPNPSQVAAQIATPFVLDQTGLPNQDNGWTAPVNRLDCDNQLCRAQLALISLAPSGFELSNQPLALFAVPPDMTDGLNNVTIDSTNTVAITKDGTPMKIQFPDSPPNTHTKDQF